MRFNIGLVHVISGKSKSHDVCCLPIENQESIMQFSLSLKVWGIWGLIHKACPSQVHWHEEMDVTAEAERAN